MKKAFEEPSLSPYHVGELCMGLFDELRCALIRKREPFYIQHYARGTLCKKEDAPLSRWVCAVAVIFLHCKMIWLGLRNF